MSRSLDILCPHFELCSGCVLNTAVTSPAILQEAKKFFHEKGVATFLFHTGSTTGWRCRAKLAVRGCSQHPQIGLYKEGTHDVVDIPLCRVHHPQINRAVDVLKEWIASEAIPLYNETTGVGVLRYLQLVVERKTGRVQLSLVINEKSLNPPLQASLSKLWDRGAPALWHSLWVNFNETRHNVIFGSGWSLINGDSLLWEQFGGVSVCFQPSSFAQANLDLFELMLERLSAMIPSGSAVLEFYAGVGVIGLYLAKKCGRVICCEINPFAEKGFEMSRQRLDHDVSQKIEFHVGKSSDFVDKISEVDTIVVDPPRKGLEKQLLKALAECSTPKKLYYISCGWSSFQTDCNTLIENGWKLQNGEGYLFFPGSEQIEILALFEKESG